MAKARPKKGKAGEKIQGMVLPHCDYDVAYEIVSLDRREIKNAPYNPRVITDKARKKLKKFLEKRGLLAPITWNKRSGNIVGGHQRLACIDGLMGSPAYTIRVAAVDMDDKTERESNLFLNNPEAQGDWDLEALEKMMRESDIDMEEAGFDLSDIYNLLGESPLAEDADKLGEMADKLRDARAIVDNLRTAEGGHDDMGFFSIIVFKSDEERGSFSETIGLDEFDYYIDGRFMWNFLEVNGLVVTGDEDGRGMDVFKRSFPKCPRCGAKHGLVSFFKFSDQPEGDFTHYASCPATGEPILAFPTKEEFEQIKASKEEESEG